VFGGTLSLTQSINQSINQAAEMQQSNYNSLNVPWVLTIVLHGAITIIQCKKQITAIHSNQMPDALYDNVKAFNSEHEHS